MTLRITLAALHLLALGIGLGSVLARGTALRRELDAERLKRAFHYDAQWGIAALLWIGTGLWRWMGAVEKPASYYTGNHIFLTKMALLVVIIVLEIWPAVVLVRWRRQLAAGDQPSDFASQSVGARIANISHTQALLVVIMVFLAVMMARGLGA